MKKLINGIYRKSLLWFMHTKFYYNIVMKVIPYIRFTLYYTSFRGWKYMRGYSKLQDGDIILMCDSKKLTTILIPGDFSHAGICVDKGAEWEASEMTHHDYTKSTFFDMCKEADRVAIIRCKDWDPEYVKNVVVPTAKSYEKAGYGADFTLGVATLYCSELVYMSDPERRLQCSLEDLAGLGQPYISPTGLYKSKNIDIIWDSNDEIDPFPNNGHK